MTEEEKNEEVKGVEVKKTLDADLEHPDLKPEIEGPTWFDWVSRMGTDFGGFYMSRSKYGKGHGVENASEVKTPEATPKAKTPENAPKAKTQVEAPKKTGVWEKVKKAVSKTNKTIDAGAEKYTDWVDDVVNNNEAMRDVNKTLDNVRDNVGEKAKKTGEFVGEKAKKTGEFVVEKAKGVVEKFKIKKTSKGSITIKESVPVVKSGTKVASTTDNVVGLAVKGGTKAVSAADDVADIAVEAADDAAKIATKTATKGGSKFIPKAIKFAAKKMPYASAYFAYNYATDRFNEDETREGIQEIVSGIAGCVPGVGSLVSIYLDFDNLMYDEYGYHPMDFHKINPMAPVPTKNQVDQFCELIETGDCADLRYYRQCWDKGEWPNKWGAVAYAQYEESEKTRKKRQEKAYKEYIANMEKEITETVNKSKSDLLKLKQESKKLADNVNLSAEELQDLSLQYREASLMVTLQENALAVVNNKKNAGSLKPNKNDFIKSVAPLYDNSGMVGDLNNYKNAELHVEYNQCEDTRTLSAMVDGKLHGAVICLSANNEVLDVKLYNHGEEVNLEDKAVDVYNCADPAFGRYCAVEVDGEKFGWELTGDVNGGAKVAFYDEGANGYVNVENINLRKHLSMKPTEMTAQSEEEQKGRFDLFYDLKAQSGGEQQLTGQYALAQAKCDLSLHNASKRDNCVEVVEPEEKSESKLVVQATPVKVDVSKER